MGVVHGPCKRWRSPLVVRVLSKLSMGVAIAHQFVIFYAFNYLHPRHLEYSGFLLLGIVLAIFAITFCVALSIQLIVQSPFEHLAKKSWSIVRIGVTAFMFQYNFLNYDSWSYFFLLFRRARREARMMGYEGIADIRF